MEVFFHILSINYLSSDVKNKIIKDKFSGEPRGFGFVEMPAKAEAEAAMNGVREIKGRMVTINEARPREPRHRGGRERRGGWR